MIHIDYIRAGSAATPLVELTELSNAICPKLRARVAENSATPSSLLEKLSSDLSTEVRIGVGNNASTSTIIRWRLAFDEALDVRFSQAENAHTGTLILMWLAGDENPYIANRAIRTLRSIAKNDNYLTSLGDIEMAAETIQRTLRRMLSNKERLSKSDAIKLKKLILSDGYVSRSEKKIVQETFDNDRLTDAALEAFIELLLNRTDADEDIKQIA